MRTSARRWRLLPSALGLAAAIVAVDAATKRLADAHLGTPIELPLGTKLSLSHNSGMAFGAFSGAPDGVVIAVVCVVVAALAVAVVRGWLPAGPLVVGLLVGGAVANLVDRVPDGRVTDFISLPAWPSFNVADVAITVAVLALVVGPGRRDAPSEPAMSTR